MDTSFDLWKSEQMETRMSNARPLYIPVILGTPRRGRFSAHVARFVAGELEKRQGVETELIDIVSLPVPIDDAGRSSPSSTYPRLSTGHMTPQAGNRDIGSDSADPC